MLAGALLLCTVAAAPPQVVVWLPESGPASARVLQAFEWAQATEVLDPAALAQRFPPSARSQTQEQVLSAAERLLDSAQAAFIQTRFGPAAKAAGECAAQLEALPPSPKTRELGLHLLLLQARVALAERSTDKAARFFDEAAASDPDAQLDAATYPPEVTERWVTLLLHSSHASLRVDRHSTLLRPVFFAL